MATQPRLQICQSCRLRCCQACSHHLHFLSGLCKVPGAHTICTPPCRFFAISTYAVTWLCKVEVLESGDAGSEDKSYKMYISKGIPWNALQRGYTFTPAEVRWLHTWDECKQHPHRCTVPNSMALEYSDACLALRSEWLHCWLTCYVTWLHLLRHRCCRR